MRRILPEVWNTRTVAATILLFCGTFGRGQSKQVHFLSAEEIKMAVPKVEMDSMLFRTAASLQMKTSQNGKIRYTLDGSEVGPMSTEYKTPIIISSSTQLRARAFHPDFLPSDEQILNLRKINVDISSAEVSINPFPSENYSGNGPKTLVNGKKGSINFRNGNDWLGFQTVQLELVLKFERPIHLEKVVLSLLQDQGSWIFSPKKILIGHGESIIGTKMLTNCGEEGNKKMDFVAVPVQKATYEQINITIHALDQIPNWHPGTGTIPWLFIDEILVE